MKKKQKPGKIDCKVFWVRGGETHRCMRPDLHEDEHQCACGDTAPDTDGHEIKPEPAAPREEVLTEAMNVVHGPRQRDYGPPRKNFEDIADAWSIILGTHVTPPQVAQAMIALKLMRLNQSPDHKDSWIDIAGYAALGYEVI